MTNASTVVNACTKVGYPGKGLCLKWVQDVFDYAGIKATRLPAAKDVYKRDCTYSDRDKLRPGMVIACPANSAHVYGHIGIYIGNNRVMDSETGGIYTRSLSNFLSAFSDYGAFKWGWYNGVQLKNDVDSTGDEAKHVDVPIETKGMYRLYNPNNGQHLFTTDHNEAETLANAGWTYEGVAWHTGNGAGVYRFYNPSGLHMFTTSLPEACTMMSQGWKYEGEAFKQGSTKDVYRLYNRSNGDHFFTASETERDALIVAGWVYESVAFKAD